MNFDKTAIILVGYQNDYFSKNGALHAVVEESLDREHLLANTVQLLESVRDTNTLLISTPILFTPNYSELIDPIGILKTIRDAGAFRNDTVGGQTISELSNFGDRIDEIPGKRGLNAFSNTDLEEQLRGRAIENVLIAGVVTSLCIDSTARHAFELGFRVSILEDCIGGRSEVEQDFYCQQVFPLYSKLVRSKDVIASVSQLA